MRRLFIAAACCAAIACHAAPAQNVKESGMLVRIAEIEVFPQHLSEYLTLANEVDRASMNKESGVICLFPMHVEGKPEQIRIVEVYRDAEAYAAHLKTEHFLKYKTSTQHMVKDLKLVTTKPLDPAAMPLIFGKMR